jgi:hypothetical protein
MRLHRQRKKLGKMPVVVEVTTQRSTICAGADMARARAIRTKSPKWDDTACDTDTSIASSRPTTRAFPPARHAVASSIQQAERFEDGNDERPVIALAAATRSERQPGANADLQRLRAAELADPFSHRQSGSHRPLGAWKRARYC